MRTTFLIATALLASLGFTAPSAEGASCRKLCRSTIRSCVATVPLPSTCKPLPKAERKACRKSIKDAKRACKRDALDGCKASGGTECPAVTTTTTLPTTLISRAWTVPAATPDVFACRRQMVAFDTYITGFRAAAPAGTYTMTLTVEDQLLNGQPVGDYACDAAALDPHVIYASGLGTGDVLFPAGSGVRLHAGQYLNLNLHLTNADGVNEAGGTSEVQVLTGSATDVSTEVEMIFAGALVFSIPSDSQPHEVTGGCTAAANYQTVALWPHLQASGTNVKVTVTHLGVPQTLLDVPYSLGAQDVHLMSAAVQQGDQLRVTCTYVNGTGSTKAFGNEISDEQCFVGIYRSPVMTGATAFECTS